MMTVKQLREILENYKPTDLVILSSDGEGNSFSPLVDSTQGFYIPDTTWGGDFVDEDDVDEDDDINLEGASRAIVLWPTN